MSVVIFYHCYLENDFVDLISTTIYKLISSGLYDVVESIYCGVLYTSDNNKEKFDSLIKNLNKIKILEYKKGHDDEYLTLKYMRNNEMLKGKKCLYIHTKSSSYDIHHQKKNNMKSWKDMMEYFCILKYKNCLELLDGRTDLVYPYYWGNFWWAKGDICFKIPEKLENSDRFFSENILEKLSGISYHIMYNTISAYELNFNSLSYKKAGD